MTRDGLSAIRALFLPPMLRENALHIRDAALRGHPLLSVEAALIVRLLRVVHCHLALQCCDQWRQGLSVQQGAWGTGHQQRGRCHAWRKGAQVIVDQSATYALSTRREHPAVVGDLA